MILPVHPQPLDDELFSSWITRLAIENGFYSHVFFKKLLGFQNEILSRDIDKLDCPALIDLLACVTSQKSKYLSSLQISSYTGELFDKICVSGNTKWLLPLGIYHRTKRRHGIVFCPMCLKEDNKPYFRKAWRVSFVTVCHKHHCMLSDRCEKCGCPVNYQRLGIGAREFETPFRELDRCFTCNSLLRDTPVRYLSDHEYLQALPYLNLLRDFMAGQQVIPSLNQPLNLSVFNGLWVLSNRLLCKRASKVREKIQAETGIVLPIITQKLTIEYLNLALRFKVLLAILTYLEDWPHEFIRLVNNTQFSLSAFSDNEKLMPFWLHTTAHKNLNHRRYIASDEEINSVIAHIRAQNRTPTIAEIASLLGVHPTSLAKREHFKK
ncbi:hypothetical protein PRUB_a1530 [Pseudoalteromonas rubra]|uniref:TniQ domain-containing protein n=1 Tax=Pseudoalteromonas rubra TaxID=43658 RepID=A0A8T0CFE2_9GAMM|nr:TniQ family protein [Pseudoalteromonas rubra]KAF7788541.1 hypothetical protein PRUB_a1530 [Pseudoalteromonas rubra]